MIGLACFSIALGLWLLVSALANWDWYKSIIDFAVTETLFGENAARWLAGILGIIAIGAGVVAIFSAQ
jgi:Na+(H+)/acetate symporter ActP